MTVLDASAVLALINGEPGSDLVEALLDGATMSTVNLAEVVGQMVDADLAAGRVAGLLSDAGVVIEPLTTEDGQLAGALRALPGGRSLSLGDRCCLALTVRSSPTTVLTADRAWAELDLPVTVQLLR